MVQNLRPTHEVLSEGLTKSAKVKNHEFCQKKETIQSRKQNRSKRIKVYASRPQRMQIFKIGSSYRRKQKEGYRRGNSHVFKTGLQTELNKDLSIKFNGMIQDTGLVDIN